MIFKYGVLLIFFSVILSSCQQQPAPKDKSVDFIDEISKRSSSRFESEKNNDLKQFLALFSKDAISLPEYQPTLKGIDEISRFYDTLFARQNVKKSEHTVEEMIDMGKTVVEIGTFHKEYTGKGSDSVISLKGKYWHIWEEAENGMPVLKGETTGLFHHAANPKSLIITQGNLTPVETAVIYSSDIPFELKAYNALMEKLVRKWDGSIRAEFFTKDARIMPFAEPTVNGLDSIRPYLVRYSNPGFNIDSIAVWADAWKYSGDWIIEYTRFKVKGHSGDYTGGAEGKGIRIWKRQTDGSLRIYRETVTHNYIE
jgi:ketosteroid isomerase-like protein